MTDKRVGIRIEGDASGLNAASTQAVAAVRKLDEAAAAAAVTGNKLTISANQQAAAMRMLPAQITDVFTSLAGGQSIGLVAIQQGGQIKDSFGGIANIARLVAPAVTVANVAIAGIAAVAGAAAYGLVRARSEQDAYTKALVLNGNAAGVTKGQLLDMQRSVSAVAGTQGQAAEALAALAGTGQVGAAQLELVTKAAVQMQRIVGVALPDTVAQFAALGKDPVQAALKLNDSTNFLTVAVYKRIAALVSQRQSDEAAAVAQEAFANSQLKKTKELEDAAGLLEKVWRAAKEQVLGFGDAILNIGRKNLTDELRTAAIALAQLSDPNRKSDDPVRDAARKEAAQQRVNDLQAQMQGEREQATAQAKVVAETKEKIKQLSDGSQAAITDGRKAAAARDLAQAMLGFQQLEGMTNQWFRENEEDARTHGTNLLTIDKARIKAQIDNIDRQIAAERVRFTSTPEGADGRAKAVLQLEAQRLAVVQQRVKLEEDEASGKYDVTPKSIDIGPTGALRDLDATERANAERAIRERKDASLAAEAELVQANKGSAIAFIRNARERGMAEIAADEEVLRQRLDLAGQSAEDRMRMEGEVATFRANRERELTERLKPEWQRQVEAWRDTTQLMRDQFDNTVNGVIRSGEDAWVRFAQTGKLSVRSLVDTIIAEQARAGYRQFVSLAADLIGKFFGGDLVVDTSGAGTPAPDLGQPRGGAATGSNYVERDMLTLLHKGEAVIPKAFNPYAGGAGAGGGLATQLKITLVNETGTPAQATTRQGKDGGLEVVLTALKQAIAGDIGGGQGDITRALQGRYGLRPSFSTGGG